MTRKNGISRREALKTAGIGLCLAAAGGCAGGAARKAPAALAFDNAEFYGPAGTFDLEAAKDAYVALMRYHGYPVYKGMREALWITDYGTGQFARLGLGARMWVNNERDRYMLMDIYLLPNQMLPEHWHEPGAGNPAKLEGWLVRHGLSHIVGEGEPNLGRDVVIPKCHLNGTATVLHEVAAGPGDFVPLNRAGARHWQFAGPQGAILSEVANVHTPSAVRHSDKALNDYFLTH
jgi:hypothetical protein